MEIDYVCTPSFLGVISPKICPFSSKMGLFLIAFVETALYLSHFSVDRDPGVLNQPNALRLLCRSVAPRSCPRVDSSGNAYANTMIIAPAVIRTPPAIAASVSFSPISIHASSITSGTLSLSSGATRDTGPNCKARK